MDGDDEDDETAGREQIQLLGAKSDLDATECIKLLFRYSRLFWTLGAR